MSQLIFAPCPVNNKTPCPVERTMIRRYELPYFCVFCQIRNRLEETAETNDWISWDQYIYRNLKQSQLPRGWKKPEHEAHKAKKKMRKKPKARPKREVGRKRKTSKRRAKPAKHPS